MPNESGFTALPKGEYDAFTSSQTIDDVGEIANFWTYTIDVF